MHRADDPPLSSNVALPDDWEIVRRHGNYRWWVVLLDLVSLAPGSPPEAPGSPPETVTLTVRQKSSGAIRTVTAHNERAAISMIIDRRFDFK
jgi:hypothetical protein